MLIKLIPLLLASLSPALALAGTLTCATPPLQLDADNARSFVAAKLPATKIIGAGPGPAGTCLISLTLSNGQTVYTDKTGRFFFYGVLLDLATGRQLSAHSTLTQ